jgi:hypothetical protein
MSARRRLPHHRRLRVGPSFLSGRLQTAAITTFFFLSAVGAVLSVTRIGFAGALHPRYLNVEPCLPTDRLHVEP